MFGRIASRLFLQFRRKALITRRFYRQVNVTPYKSYRGAPADWTQGLSRVWAQATRSFGKYVIREKELITHHDLLAPGKSKLKRRKVVLTVNGKKKKRFTRDEVVAILQKLEKQFQQEGYHLMPEQPFERRTYIKREAKREAKEARKTAKKEKRAARAAAKAAKNSPPAP